MEAPSFFTVMATGQIDSAEVSRRYERSIMTIRCMAGDASRLMRRVDFAPSSAPPTPPSVANAAAAYHPTTRKPRTRTPSTRRNPQHQIPGCETAYCKFEIVAGEDWQLLDGMEAGITQVARQSFGEQGKRSSPPSPPSPPVAALTAIPGCIPFHSLLRNTNTTTATNNTQHDNNNTHQ